MLLQYTERVLDWWDYISNQSISHKSRADMISFRKEKNPSFDETETVRDKETHKKHVSANVEIKSIFQDLALNANT